MKILHAIPAYNMQVNGHIAGQAVRDCREVEGMGFAYDGPRVDHSCDLIQLRNRTFHQAVSQGYDLLFIQDADVFSPSRRGPLRMLLESWRASNAAVVGAPVPLRGEGERINVHPWHPGKVYECEFIGTGMLLIDLAQVREWYSDFEGPCFWRTYQSPRAINPKISMDVHFTRDVVRGRFKQAVVCDARISTVHVDATSGSAYNTSGVAKWSAHCQ